MAQLPTPLLSPQTDRMRLFDRIRLSVDYVQRLQICLPATNGGMADNLQGYRRDTVDFNPGGLPQLLIPAGYRLVCLAGQMEQHFEFIGVVKSKYLLACTKIFSEFALTCRLKHLPDASTSAACRHVAGFSCWIILWQARWRHVMPWGH